MNQRRIVQKGDENEKPTKIQVLVRQTLEDRFLGSMEFMSSYSDLDM